ncbi:glycoside hydrolase family 3 C-terminal domain-containing protein [Streptomyces sp. NBC_01242]|uniref:beta-xylosidase/alpha-l-arabinosidase n=1 Tax=unclassified Streptomyces TaxID=2593676 RepID=UPI0022511F26|nr:glycoside hydrolase family 3 N-terminal domain-containing protein [Streptomyces sp. NBC_01242]MCX4798956.1 glycoside hydrolase family 3 C-terminal domain-containing protein [Streptomyces sp. NBC_01242]WSP53703.1 glycoside hydrolase family 3 C-terminal domain-containing protein [Streptomyces sp. NBC_01241]WSU25629.1 glycoside hydrolase family 3 C-terminal domain-containing protein [Streptomyces sp. NBC_01108]
MATQPVPHARRADPDPAVDGPWRDPSLTPEERVADLVPRMTLEEKATQLYGVWVGADADGDGVAPHQNDMDPVDWEDVTAHGLGQLTRPFGTAPVDPGVGAVALARAQHRITESGRFAIPALAHEECLAGFTAWGATAYPVPLSWGASWDPELVTEMAGRIGRDMRSVGIHQGLAPVLDVVRDLRWGRVEETIGEDPYLVATIGTAYVRGLESAGIVATLKHFAGYAASAGARNHAPVRAGAREMADIVLPPFEMALREGGARSVMHSYAEIDGLPAAADPALLTGLLRDTWGFTGTVVADYFGIGFLETLHKVAADRADAARLALGAGVDVELPTVHSYGEVLVTAVRDGAVAEELVDRALHRVLLQKCELGLLDPDWTPLPTVLHGTDPEQARATVDLDPPENRALARKLAEEACVLLANPAGALPLRGDGRIAVVGPRADDALAMLGCYSFPSHVGVSHPEVPMGIGIPTVLESLRAEFPAAKLSSARGCDVDGTDTSNIATAAELARDADVCVAVLGDRAGLFGRGTSGEGCDAADLSLPGVQGELLDALLATGTPVVLVLLTGRPYALGRWAGRTAATVQAFFPGEEGGPALAGVLSGRVNPCGRLPVGIPHGPGGQPWTYLQPPLGLANEVSNLDPTPLHPFGHGLSYTTFDWESGGSAPAEIRTDGSADIEVTVRNTGDREGVEVVQLYVHDPVAQTTRPQARLIGYARVELAAGQARKVTFRFHADLVSFTGIGGRRIVEPGDLELRLATSSAVRDIRQTMRLRLTGPERTVDHRRRLVCETTIEEAAQFPAAAGN